MKREIHILMREKGFYLFIVAVLCVTRLFCFLTQNKVKQLVNMSTENSNFNYTSKTIPMFSIILDSVNLFFFFNLFIVVVTISWLIREEFSKSISPYVISVNLMLNKVVILWEFCVDTKSNVVSKYRIIHIVLYWYVLKNYEEIMVIYSKFNCILILSFVLYIIFCYYNISSVFNFQNAKTKKKMYMSMEITLGESIFIVSYCKYFY